METVSPVRPRVRRRPTPHARVLAGLSLVAGLCGITSGCAYPGCTEPTLSAEPVVVDDPSAPVTLSVQVADDDGPITGRRVTFFVLTRGGDTTGVRAGQADTDADGRASLTREDGIYGPALPNETVHGYKVKFSVLGTVDGKTYCPTEVEAPITCRAGDSEGTCEPKPFPG